MSKKKNVLDNAKAIDKLNRIEVPTHVWRFLGCGAKYIDILGSDQISLGEDYGNIEEVREAVEWYAQQLGGIALWCDDEDISHDEVFGNED